MCATFGNTRQLVLHNHSSALTAFPPSWLAGSCVIMPTVSFEGIENLQRSSRELNLELCEYTLTTEPLDL